MIVTITYTTPPYPWRWDVSEKGGKSQAHGYCGTARGARRKGRKTAKELTNNTFEVK